MTWTDDTRYCLARHVIQPSVYARMLSLVYADTLRDHPTLEDVVATVRDRFGANRTEALSIVAALGMWMEAGE